MSFKMRPFRDEEDYWRIRKFLRDVYLLNGRRELAWQAYRFDYWRWHVNENIFQFPLAEVVFIWVTAEGRIGGVLNPEGSGEAFLQVHPALRTPALEAEMIAVAEAHLAIPGEDGRPRLRVWANEGDAQRQELLARQGYHKVDRPECRRRRLLTTPIPDVPQPAGYTVRALGGEEELPARSYLSWQAFHPDEPDDEYEGWEWYRNVQHAPLYRRQLDIVAVAPDSTLASFCTAWFDDVTRTGAFEPVGTVPAHQKRGLGAAVMVEALRRLKRLDATLATVSSSSPAAGALYASVGFTDYDLCLPWTK